MYYTLRERRAMNSPGKPHTLDDGRRGLGDREPEPEQADAAEERVDGRFEITVSEDRMRAFISLFPSGGGTPLAVERIKKSLSALKVVFGVNDELLKRLVDNVERTKDEKSGVIIAQGLLPEEGKGGYVKYHVKGGDREPGAGGPDGDGSDGRGIRATARVAKGDLVASVVKSVPGRDGRDVLGNAVPAAKVADPKVVAGLNIRVDKGSLYTAAVDGIVEAARDEAGVTTISARPFADGEFAVRVPDGDMEVLVDIRPSVGGGRPVDPARVREECTRQGVTAAVDAGRIREAVARAEREQAPVEGVLVASGEPPVHGRNGSVSFPVRSATGSRLRRREDGSVDYKEQDLFTTVEKGTVVAVLTQPGRAVRDGRTVRGRAVQAKDGRDAALSAGNNTLVEEKGETARFIAAIDGRLFCDGKSVSVERVMVVEGDVGPKTGNVRFNGVVEITGDVLDGYQVHGKKGVTVRGNVGNARVVSEGAVTVRGGVIGKGNGTVSAGSGIAVKFAENARMEARGDIVVHRAAMNCTILTEGKIVAVTEKGLLVGGELRARLGVVAKTLGNESEHRTEIFVGSDFFVERTLQETKRRLERCAAEVRTLDLALEKASRGERKTDPRQDRGDGRSAAPSQASAAPEAGESQRKKAELAAEAEALQRVENECLLKLNELFDAEVTAQETLFKGVKVHIGKLVYEPDGTRTKTRVFYDREQRRIDTGRL
jgi:hypothetical protein